MSKTKNADINLPLLQSLIIRHLTEAGPQTINQTSHELGKQYKATHYAFDSLTKKGLVCQKGTYNWRGRKFPQHWLTNQGILTALMAEMNSKKFTKNIELFGNIGNNSAPLVFLANSLESTSPRVRASSKEIISFLLSRMTEETESSQKEQTMKETQKMLEEETKFYEDLKSQFPEMWNLLTAMKAVVLLFEMLFRFFEGKELPPPLEAEFEEITPIDNETKNDEETSKHL